MEAKARLPWCLLGLPVVGLASALAALRVDLGVIGRINVLGSLTFGILLSAWLWAFLGFRSIRKILECIFFSPVAAVLAIWTAVFVDGRFGITNPDDLRLYFIGGFVGAFLLMLVASFLVTGSDRLLRAILQALVPAAAGGVLAVAGRIAGNDFRAYWMRLDPRQPGPDTSLIFIWHTGMVLVLGLALWLKKSTRRREVLDLNR